MSGENATVNIPKDVLEPILRAHISAAVLAAIGDQKRIMSEAVAQVLNQPVDGNGQPPRYQSDRTEAWSCWMMRQCIQEAAKTAVVEYLTTHKDDVKKQLAAELCKKNSPLVRSLIEGMAGAMTSEHALKYRLNVTVDTER